jgi:hypothetical protein
VTLAPGVVGRVSIGELFESYAMKSAPVEEAREMGGLLVVAGWMALLALRRRGARGVRLRLPDNPTVRGDGPAAIVRKAKSDPVDVDE